MATRAQKVRLAIFLVFSSSVLGGFLLIVAGGLIALAGGAYIVLTLTLSDQVVDGALALFAVTIGTVVAMTSLHALRPAHWKAFSLSSEWVWLITGTMKSRYLWPLLESVYSP